MQTGRRQWKLFAPPDRAALEIAAGGERFVAKTRLVFFGVIWIIPAAMMLGEPRSDLPVSLVAASFAVFVSALFLSAVRRERGRRAMPFLTSGFDVTIVSVTLVAFALIGRPHLAINSMVVWEIYLLAIMATVLRFDVRVSLFAGSLAILQYIAVVTWVTLSWDVSAPDPTQLSGKLSWPVQVARLLLMVATVVLSIAAVVRSRGLIDLSGTDQLTRLPNRMYFEERFRSELLKAGRAGTSLVVAMLDLDRFKSLNDQWGHDAGDSALRAVADLIRQRVSVSDLVARWGGEELIVVFVGISIAEAEDRLNAMRMALSTTELPGLGASVRLTFSAGAAEYPGDGGNHHDLIATADRRLLQAKVMGRDRVVCGDAERGVQSA
ncbi:MAG TPA: GGDEF domain-containing protein [Thermoanaerobaculia bacterium]|nr:GGDEF domain-containing protein [Thermoanaerobaculia bacterium]